MIKYAFICVAVLISASFATLAYQTSHQDPESERILACGRMCSKPFDHSYTPKYENGNCICLKD